MTTVYEVRFFSETIGLDDYTLGYYSSWTAAEEELLKLKDIYESLSKQHIERKASPILINIIEHRVDQSNYEFWKKYICENVFN